MVLIETSLGNITVRAGCREGPVDRRQFPILRWQRHFTIRRSFTRSIRAKAILGGGYGTNLIEKPARTPIRNEAHNGLKNRRGTIAMVRQPDAIDSATCQFFINVADNPALDYKDRTPAGYGYCVFGEVIAGMDVVDKINNVPVHNASGLDRTPVQPVVVKSIRRIR